MDFLADKCIAEFALFSKKQKMDAAYENQRRIDDYEYGKRLLALQLRYPRGDCQREQALNDAITKALHEKLLTTKIRDSQYRCEVNFLNRAFRQVYVSRPGMPKAAAKAVPKAKCPRKAVSA
jgi:hypothetical protein